MINFLKKYAAFGFGFIILIPIIFLLHYYGFIIIPDDAPYELIFVFVFWWIVISLPIYKFSYLKKKKRTVYNVLGLLAILIVTLIIDSNWGIPDNPFTIFMLIIFWVGVIYVLIPAFVSKYWKLLAIVYGLSMLYFTYVRLFSIDLQTYLDQEKGMAFAFFVIPIPLLMALWVYEQWKWLKELKAGKAHAELELLKTQINPHFFFNTLNNLYSLTVKHSDKAPDVILKLSDMMRYTIYEGKKDQVLLKDEIDYLNNYIDLHKIRYHKNVDIQFTHNVSQNDIIAPLLFIILLENAFKHGVESLSKSAYIHMDLTCTSNVVYFTIENNFSLGENSEDKGIGLENLRRRLDFIYPKTHTLVLSENNNIFKVELTVKIK